MGFSSEVICSMAAERCTHLGVQSFQFFPTLLDSHHYKRSRLCLTNHSNTYSGGNKMIMTTGAKCEDFDLAEVLGCTKIALQHFLAQWFGAPHEAFGKNLPAVPGWMTSYFHGNLQDPCIPDGWNKESRPEGTRSLHVKLGRDSSVETLVLCIVDYHCESAMTQLTWLYLHFTINITVPCKSCLL